MKKLLALFCAAQFATSALAQYTPTQIPSAILGNSFYRCGSLIGANFNTTADQQITLTLPYTTYSVQAIQVTNPSTSLTTAAGGFYTGAGKTGFQIVASSATYTALTTSTHNTAGSRTALSVVQTALLDATSIYFSLTTAQGSTATADIYVYCIPYS